jgi:uncharacterized damage-inducible protein DinB
MPSEIITPAEGIGCRDAALFVTQLDRLTSTLWQDISDLTRDELAWQPAPGMNTIGMLLAHIALAEVYWMDRGVRGVEPTTEGEVLGIGLDDDGIPLAPRGAPPAALQGKDVGFFNGLLVKARAHTHRVAAALTDQDMEREFERRRRPPAGSCTHNVRWVFYHVLEHLAGHYGQILMLRHMYRARTLEGQAH